MMNCIRLELTRSRKIPRCCYCHGCCHHRLHFTWLSSSSQILPIPQHSPQNRLHSFQRVLPVVRPIRRQAFQNKQSTNPWKFYPQSSPWRRQRRTPFLYTSSRAAGSFPNFDVGSSPKNQRFPKLYPSLANRIQKNSRTTTSQQLPSFSYPFVTQSPVLPTRPSNHPGGISTRMFQHPRRQRQSSSLLSKSWGRYPIGTLPYHHTITTNSLQIQQQQQQQVMIRWKSDSLPQPPNNQEETTTTISEAAVREKEQGSSTEEIPTSSSVSPPPPPHHHHHHHPNITVISASEHPVQQRIRAYVNDLNLTDQVSVILIATFTAIVLLAPYAIRHMKEHSDTWHERLHTDDPVDELAQLARAGWSIIEDDNTLETNESDGEDRKKNILENILKDVFQSKALQHAAQDFFVQILQSERFQQAVSRLVKELWNDLVSDPETVAQVIHLLEVAIRDPKIKMAVQELVLQVFVREPEVRDALIRTIESLGDDPAVRAAVIQLLTDATHATLNDPEILDHSMEFATDVVGDDIVQQTAGDALRKSFKHAVLRPVSAVFLTAMGVGLIIFSIFAVGYSRSSEQEAVLLETAARSLRFNVSFGIVRILTWPLRQCQRVFSRATASLLPLVESIGDHIERSVDRILRLLTQVVLQALSLPLLGIRSVGEWILKSLGRMIHHLLENVQIQRRNAHASLVAAMSSFVFMCRTTIFSWAGQIGKRSSALATGVSTWTVECWKGMIVASSNSLMYFSSHVSDWVSRMLQRLDKLWRSSEKDTWDHFE